ncbi:MAG TPA: hypothetical protein VFS80_11935 [Burkholderiales bacterium]|nr:hypothetical protein [Burkholderiales bacterium]
MRSNEAREAREGTLERGGECFRLGEVGLGQLAIGGRHAHLVESLIENFQFGNHQLLQ